MTTVQRLAGEDFAVFTTIGPFAMNHDVIFKRGNLPIITKPNYTWHILKEDDKVKAFMASELIGTGIKLQSFVIIEANKKELDALIKDAVDNFKDTDRNKLTISVLKEHVELFTKRKFKIVREKTNWTDLELTKE